MQHPRKLLLSLIAVVSINGTSLLKAKPAAPKVKREAILDDTFVSRSFKANLKEKSSAREIQELAIDEAGSGQNTLVVIALDPTLPRSQGPSIEFLESRFFGEGNGSLNNYIETISKGKTWVHGEVMEAQISGICDFDPNIHQDLLGEKSVQKTLKEISGETDLDLYDRLFIISPDSESCEFSLGGLGTVGKVDFIYEDSNNIIRNIYISAAIVKTTNIGFELAVIEHEFGHNLGLNHANSNTGCGDEIFNADFNCQGQEYGDPYNSMGIGIMRYYGSYQQEYLDFLGENEIVKLGESSFSETISIAPMNSDSDLPKAIKIDRSVDDLHYYVEYRDPKGLDKPIDEYKDTVKTNGAVISLESQKPLLIDTTPGSHSFDGSDAVLKKGKVFSDPINQIEVETLEVLEDELIVRVSKTNLRTLSTKDTEGTSTDKRKKRKRKKKSRRKTAKI